MAYPTKRHEIVLRAFKTSTGYRLQRGMKARMVNITLSWPSCPAQAAEMKSQDETEPETRHFVPSVRQTAWRRKPAWNDAAGLDNFPTNSLAEQNCT
jgi:hypothetical protein